MADYIRRILAKAQFTGNFQSEYPTALIHALLDDVPSEDVRPVVRGRWVWDPDGLDWGLGCWVCNQCHSRNANIPAQKDMKPLDWAGSKFCPECGADMREESNKWHGGVLMTEEPITGNT